MINVDFIANECTTNTNPSVLRAIVRTESSFNPFAIGVVGGQLVRQPRSKEEAIATALALKTQGFNYSMGLGQVNQSNLAKFGLNHETVFDPCLNLKAGSKIFQDCHQRASKKFSGQDTALKAALSCYYSGNFVRGQQREGQSPSYADKVLSNLSTDKGNVPNALAIPVISSSSKKPTPAAKKAAPPTTNAESLNPVSQGASWDVFGDF